MNKVKIQYDIDIDKFDVYDKMLDEFDEDYDSSILYRENYHSLEDFFDDINKYNKFN